jgi:hypothetical protein
MSITMHTFNLGDRVAITKGPGIIHFAIVSGPETVIDNSITKGCVTERPFREFADGKPVRGIPTTSKYSPQEVVARARLRIGKPYGCFSQNCEHFVNEVQTGIPKSTQALVGGGIALAVLWYLFKK